MGRIRKLRRNVFELDITWRCNMACNGCTRSCDILPSDDSEDMHPEYFEQQLNETGAHDWHRIFIMGGEPTLHPLLYWFINIFLKYKRNKNPRCEMCIVSNCKTEETRNILDRLPKEIGVRRARKDIKTEIGALPGDFWTMHVAPKDFQEFDGIDYKYGCGQQRRCGLQLTKNGWYHCSMIGGIDRVFKFGGDTFQNTLKNPRFDLFCPLCGRFRLSYVPKNLGGYAEGCLEGDKNKMLLESLKAYPVKSGKKILSKSYAERLRING